MSAGSFQAADVLRPACYGLGARWPMVHSAGVMAQMAYQPARRQMAAWHFPIAHHPAWVRYGESVSIVWFATGTHRTDCDEDVCDGNVNVVTRTCVW